MSSSKENDLLREFAAGVYLSEAQNPIPPLLTHCIRVCSFKKGRREGGELNKRRLEGQQFTKLGRKYQHDSISPYPYLHISSL
jgi:hypothetical protein